jgi:hypothetical protein
LIFLFFFVFIIILAVFLFVVFFLGIIGSMPYLSGVLGYFHDTCKHGCKFGHGLWVCISTCIINQDGAGTTTAGTTTASTDTAGTTAAGTTAAGTTAIIATVVTFAELKMPLKSY